jgi:tetratricopeptide (TPR) repeat protein/cellulose biosynthesis protein BcsQ
MKTISFYSYKGGVGRSLALAYIAKHLARENRGVFVLDLDLEAPGIIYKFKDDPDLAHPDVEPIDKALTKPGAVDYIDSFINGDKAPDDLSAYTSTVFEANKSGYVKIMNAGQNINSVEYWTKLSGINWKKQFLEGDREGLYILENLRHQIEKQINPDYLLIDSRSGVTILSIICNSVLPDKVVMLLANNDENFYGSALMYNHIASSKEYRINKKEWDDDSKSRIFCAITRYPSTDSDNSKSDKLREAEIENESRLVTNFLSIVGNPKKLNRKDVIIIHSDRDIEISELSILNKDKNSEIKIPENKYEKREGKNAEIKMIEYDYAELIDKIFEGESFERHNDDKQLEKDEALKPKIPRPIFIEFDLHKAVNDELNKMNMGMTHEEFRGKLMADIAENPKSCRLLYKLALCERYDKNVRKFGENLYDAIDNSSEGDEYRIHALYWRGMMFLYDLNNYKYAVKDLELVYNLNKLYNRQICYHLAVCCYYLREHDKALTYIDHYLSDFNNENNSLDPYIYLVRANINKALLENGKKMTEKDNIFSDYNKSISLDENFKSAYIYRGIFYFYLREYENAINDFRKVIDIDPGYKIAYCARGRVLAALGKIEEAFDDYDKTVKLDKYYNYVYFLRGNLYYDLGKINEAFLDYKKAIQNNPERNIERKIREEILPIINYYKKLEAVFQYALPYDYYDCEGNVDKYTFPPVNPSVKYYKIDEYFEFVIRKSNNKKIISDQGKTYRMLDKIYELKEPDVIKNLVSVLREFQVRMNGADFSIEIQNTDHENDDNNRLIEEAKYKLFRCVSFMNNMLILYNNKPNEIDDNKFKEFDKTDTEKQAQSIIKTISIPARYYGIFIKYEFALVKQGGKTFLSDRGKTYKMLDKIFELSEPDVQKNLNAIMRRCRVSQYKDEFLIEINPEDEGVELENHEATYRLFECVSFMDAMRIFYVA